MSNGIIRADFNTRVAEIEKYFEFIKHLEDDNRVLTNYDKSNSISIDDDHLKIFKANGFLLLYNLIESTMLNSVVSIFDEIKVKGLSYNDLSEQVKKYWFKYKYKHDENMKLETLYNKFYIIVEDIVKNVTLELIDKLEYGGSIDAQRIKNLAKSLGVVFVHHGYNKDTHGKALVEIKQKRNSLAHGNESFANVGKDITYYGNETVETTGIVINSFGMKHFKDFTIEHLDKFIDSVETYIANETYKTAV